MGRCGGRLTRASLLQKSLLRLGCASRPQITAQASVWQPAVAGSCFSPIFWASEGGKGPPGTCPPPSPRPGLAPLLLKLHLAPRQSRRPPGGLKSPGGQLTSAKGASGWGRAEGPGMLPACGGQRGLWAGHFPSCLTWASLQAPHGTGHDPAARRLAHRGSCLHRLTILSPALDPGACAPSLLSREHGQTTWRPPDSECAPETGVTEVSTSFRGWALPPPCPSPEWGRQSSEVMGLPTLRTIQEGSPSCTGKTVPGLESSLPPLGAPSRSQSGFPGAAGAPRSREPGSGLGTDAIASPSAPGNK